MELQRPRRYKPNILSHRSIILPAELLKIACKINNRNNFCLADDIHVENLINFSMKSFKNNTRRPKKKVGKCDVLVGEEY